VTSPAPNTSHRRPFVERIDALRRLGGAEDRERTMALPVLSMITRALEPTSVSHAPRTSDRTAAQTPAHDGVPTR
jgi:hypothetical protein